ncbi:hypothetical protein BU25DRAFT_405301 [Macroventuria anomochaeta]|uniref:Uncharacterized protein n=1 Tax=Macroventuria anomochaeta TaxID=301207 RepID=A0ACB6SGN9_9PLEO|nr:uncharacterized protein BU25DRAFT_405301 [Macroventuria anomochaeta]KAF2633406.1 hypothetical protein BU25DRAFT_405301 [Macroventuria anomochaeta]
MHATDSRTRRRGILKHSLLFNKAKHSEDWHQAIDAIAGVLHPPNPKFPYPLLRQATEAYLKKKGKITQADKDIRLAILIDAHEARDIAVAAAAHAMTATSLRALLHVDLNVAHGSYWGLETWLQCLIAANYGNSASVTGLEATWAQYLLPFATHGPGAAGKILIGVSRALRECATPNMNVVPDFLALTSRALTDYGAHLEGLRLKNNWIAAYGASCWMAELGRTLPASTSPGFLLPEHILDAQFPVWRVWASWRPDLRLVRILSSIDSNSAAVLSDLLALEGPDFISRAKSTLRDGLIEQYGSDRSFIKLGGLLIEVPSRTKDGLREILESSISTLESIWTTAVSADRLQLFKLFTELTIARPMTQEGLNLVQAVLFITKGTKGGLGSVLLNAVLCIYTERNNLGGSHIRELQDLIQLFDHDHASSLRRILSTPTLLQGISRCIQDRQTAVRTLIEQDQPWTELALELHTFCSALKSSKSVPIVGEKMIEQMCLLLPPAEHITMAIDIYTAARNRNSKAPIESTNTGGSIDKGKQKREPGQRIAAPAFLTGQTKGLQHPLDEVVEQYFLHRLLSQQAASYTSQRTLDPILRVWESTCAPKLTQKRRSLVILVAKITSDDTNLRIRCLNGIASTGEQLGPGLSLEDLLMILQDIDRNPEHRIVRLIRLLASCPTAQEILCWRDLAYHLLAQETHLDVFKDRNLVDHSLKTMKAAEWLSFLADVQSVFASGPALPSDENAVPPILRVELQKYRLELAPYTNTLTRLEEVLGDENDAVNYILSRGGARSNNILAILQTLKYAEKGPVESFLHKIVGMLSTKVNNEWEVSDCVSIIFDACGEVVEVCKKIWNAKHGFLMITGLSNLDQQSVPGINGRNKTVAASPSTPKTAYSVVPVRTSAPIDPTASKYDVPISVVEIMVTGWLLDENAAENTKNAVRSIACLLNIVQTGFNISRDKLTEAATFWGKIEDEIIQEADRLGSLRKTLKAKDAKGTTLLLQQIGIPDTTELDEEMMKLPAGVMDVVERIGNNEVEIAFSLAAFTQLQRGAMGIPESANMLMLQLFLDYNKDSPPSFCLHYNTDAHLETMAHTRYSCSTESQNPTKQICTSAQTALTWQLGRIIYSKLCRGITGIADIYQHITAWLPDLPQLCVSCSATHNLQTAQLRRSIPCDSHPYSCARLWYNLPLHVRIPEIRTDTFAVDIALSSVYAAAMTNKPELLPSCPIRGNELIKSILNSLPAMRVIRDAVAPSSILSSYHPQAEKLISWAVVHHRGFLATATGLLKIPNLPPGTHQFVLANASPKLESTVVQKIQSTKRETTVLFHGTSLDRLPAILAQGLRVCSGTSLQRTGAAHGKGIYLSDEPATSFYYSPTSLSWKNSGLSNMRMLLGCELVGSGNRVSGKIHVVTDVGSVMVRYILLFTREARMPIRGHIEPAMASGMKALRNGAV